MIRRIYPSVLLLERGQIFELCGKRVFTMGGASSHDIQGGVLEPDAPWFLQSSRCSTAKVRPFESTTSPSGKRNCLAKKNT